MGQRADGPDRAHRRPEGVSDATVEALGRLSEALECVERARGHLYELHQLIGHADLMLDDAVEMLRAAGHPALAERIDRDLLGRNVIAGRWTFQIVEDFDDGYYALFRELDRQARDELVEGRRHLYEAEMKERRRSRGMPGHEARPGTS
ncbi:MULTISPECIES: hypothetical protein [unclassified Micromonospora]|uniref:hypothetical protein n=1 Tax=unclassified Micromonospora TaxID=2617518 RepID=UPI001C22EAB4|nr:MULTISPECIES: hypothetical protein [unclassified Micromonospora]MBU8859991.1 hypothetical protein [Micromonospora sp. WMMB482]MDM4779518.1 hypothetical protein [Micromonospora sp. b486]